MKTSLFIPCSYLILILLSLLSCITLVSSVEEKPNIIVILTDEHNLRTIGKYRDLLTKAHSTDQAFVWGDDVKVTTQHIDSLADNGAIFSNFHTVSPLCTTSRGALLTGTYPSTNGADGNHVPMKGNATTFAQVLQDEFDYNTAYMGKWHLNGKTKGKKQFGAPEGRSFGFNETSLLWNRGHWKFLDNRKGNVTGLTYKQGLKRFSSEQLSDFYTTDFLTNETINYIQSQKSLNKHFALVVSYPDPHAPLQVRPPYDTMFNEMNFSLPMTAKAAILKDPAAPSWSYRDRKFRNIKLADAEEKINEIEASEKYQWQMSQSFGMIKLIDDSVGRIMKALDETGLSDNTIIVFTSDHGDMMAEHANNDKVLPYKASAGVPFIISWPKKIRPKVVETSYSSVDFVPTLLNLVGVQDTESMGFQGIDASADLLDDEDLKAFESQIRFIDGPSGRYAAAVNGRYTLVLNKKGVPWLFDSEEDPDELYNYYKVNEFYDQISTNMQSALYFVMLKYDFGLLSKFVPVLMDRPACEETLDNLGDVFPFHTCADIGEMEDPKTYCAQDKFQRECPVTCKLCVEDSTGLILLKGNMMFCRKQVTKNPTKFCQWKYIKSFCPETCNDFLEDTRSGRNIFQPNNNLRW